MPIYEFACRNCNADFEKIVPASQRDAVPCPTCGNAKTMRKISLSAPAQIAAANPSCGTVRDCAAPTCCGGMCGMPN